MTIKTKTCPHCGKRNPISNKVCEHCGNHLEAKDKQTGSPTNQANMDLLEEEIHKVNGVFTKIRIYIAVLLVGLIGVALFYAFGPSHLREGISALVVTGFVLLAAVLIFAILGWWYGIKKMSLQRKLRAMPEVRRMADSMVDKETGQREKRAQKKPAAWVTVLTVCLVILALVFSLRLIVPLFMDTFGLGSGSQSAATSSDFLGLKESLLNLLGLSSGGSGGGACASVPVKVISCSCSDQNSQGVWCEVESGASECYTNSHGVRMCTSGTGEGRIPYACTQQLGFCR